MKTRFLLWVSLVLAATPLYAGGTGGTGLMSPEPGTVGLLGAAVLVGLPAYYWRRRHKQAEVEDVTAGNDEAQ